MGRGTLRAQPEHRHTPCVSVMPARPAGSPKPPPRGGATATYPQAPRCSQLKGSAGKHDDIASWSPYFKVPNSSPEPESNPFVQRYLDVAREVGQEFTRARRLHGKRIHCRRGCTDCCHHIFQISETEAAYVSAGFGGLADRQREKLSENAKAYLRSRDTIMQEHGYIEAWGNLPRAETRLACPALVDGLCSIYDHRPLICRKFGVPLHYPDKPGRIFACELNFSPGEAIEDGKLVQIQTGTAERWSGLQHDYDRAGGLRHEFPITVAHAIPNDFQGHLPK